MKLFIADQIREIDSFTIKNEPIKSIDLMERAASSLYKWISSNIDRNSNLLIFTGPGNNGGDGLSLARILKEERYKVEVCHLDFTQKRSVDWEINMKRLSAIDVEVTLASTVEEIPIISYNSIIIDAIFGTGLKRGVDGFPLEAIKHINDSGNTIIALDVPSGLSSEDNSKNDPDSIIRADITLTLQFPKISFFMADSFVYIGHYEIIPIGLHPRAIREMSSDYYTVNSEVVKPMLKEPGKFDHKGVNGHGLLVAGSCGKVGAAVLAARAALRTGIGLLTLHLPRPSSGIIHSAVPEAMVQCDQSDVLISDIYKTSDYDAIGVGPGIGTKPNTIKALEELLKEYSGAMVIDADAINIISLKPSLLDLVKENALLTPHPGEFDRLAGKSDSSFERLMKQRELSERTGCTIVLKGANTSISLADGRIWFNISGNPGMATAGSGDVLTGMILSLLAQGYSLPDAAIIGVYLHGLSGDIASENYGFESLIASDIIDNIGQSFKRIRNE